MGRPQRHRRRIRFGERPLVRPFAAAALFWSYFLPTPRTLKKSCRSCHWPISMDDKLFRSESMRARYRPTWNFNCLLCNGSTSLSAHSTRQSNQIESALTKKKPAKPASPLPVDKTNHQLQKKTKLPKPKLPSSRLWRACCRESGRFKFSNPFGVMGQMTVELFANAMFRGQIVGPGGQSAVQGMWQITQLNQLVLQGQGTNGFITMPYHTVVQFTTILPNHLAGLSSVGEQIVCQKIS